MNRNVGSVNEPATSDQLLLSARYVFPPGSAVPDAVVRNARDVSTHPDRVLVYLLGEFDLGEAPDGSMQEPFDAAITKLITAISAVDLESEVLQSVGGRLDVDLALVPDLGQAGIFLGRDALARIVAAGGNLVLAAWPGASWFDAKYPQQSTELTSD